MSMEKLCFTIEELHKSQILPLGLNKLYELAKSPSFPAKRIGRKILVSKSGLEKWAEDNSQKYF